MFMAQSNNVSVLWLYVVNEETANNWWCYQNLCGVNKMWYHTIDLHKYYYEYVLQSKH